MGARQHWERVYRTKLSTAESWYAPYLGTLFGWSKRRRRAPPRPL